MILICLCCGCWSVRICVLFMNLIMMWRLCVIGLRSCMKFFWNCCNCMIVMYMISVSVVLLWLMCKMNLLVLLSWLSLIIFIVVVSFRLLLCCSVRGVVMWVRWCVLWLSMCLRCWICVSCIWLLICWMWWWFMCMRNVDFSMRLNWRKNFLGMVCIIMFIGCVFFSVIILSGSGLVWIM